MNLKEIHYGIEIETVKRTREQIAWAIHSVVGGTVRHVGFKKGRWLDQVIMQKSLGAGATSAPI